MFAAVQGQLAGAACGVGVRSLRPRGTAGRAAQLQVGASGAPLLEVKDLHARVAGTDKDILKGLTISIKEGEVHAIMGKNGSGKSTLSKVLVGHPAYEVTSGAHFSESFLLPHFTQSKHKTFLLSALRQVLLHSRGRISSTLHLKRDRTWECFFHSSPPSKCRALGATESPVSLSQLDCYLQVADSGPSYSRCGAATRTSCVSRAMLGESTRVSQSSTRSNSTGS